jgi:hypothetical protein
MRSVEFTVATNADDPDLRRMLKTNPLPGEITVSLEREPDALAAGAISGDPHHTIIARDPVDGRPIGMGSRSVYSGYCNGVPCRIGYLSQLRVERPYRGRIRLLSDGYRLIRGLRRADELPFDLTTIVADNRPARRVLGAGLRELPVYRELEPFTTLVVPVWRRHRMRRSREFTIARGSLETIPDIAECLERNRPRLQFAPRWTACDLSSPLRSRGLSPGDFVIAIAAGRVVGCLAVWDQRSFKQIVVQGYGPALQRWRPVTDLVARVAGTPTLPAPGRPIPHAFVSHVAIDDDRHEVFGALFVEACNDARGRGLVCLIAGFAERHPFLRVIRNTCRAWSYSSLIYAVQWNEGGTVDASIDGRMPHLEVGLL